MEEAVVLAVEVEVVEERTTADGELEAAVLVDEGSEDAGAETDCES